MEDSTSPRRQTLRSDYSYEAHTIRITISRDFTDAFGRWQVAGVTAFFTQNGQPRRMELAFPGLTFETMDAALEAAREVAEKHAPFLPSEHGSDAATLAAVG